MKPTSDLSRPGELNRGALTKFNWERLRREVRYEGPAFTRNTGSFRARHPGWCPLCKSQIAIGQVCCRTIVSTKMRYVHQGCASP